MASCLDPVVFPVGDVPWAYHLLLEANPQTDDCPTVNSATLLEHMLSHPFIEQKIAQCTQWPWMAMKNHKQAKHPLHLLAFLADIGLKSSDDLRLQRLMDTLLDYANGDFMFQLPVELPAVFGGPGKEERGWMLCDAPLILDSMIRMEGADPDLLHRYAEKLLDYAQPQGFRCACYLPGVQGPGKKKDPCPYATLLCLRALSHYRDFSSHDGARQGLECLLYHWETQLEAKLRFFGIGTDFRKIKYPMIWYDLLHVVDVLSRYPAIHHDTRFQEMTSLLFSKVSRDGTATAESVWMVFKGFDFAQKREPSPTLAACLERIRLRLLRKDTES